MKRLLLLAICAFTSIQLNGSITQYDWGKVLNSTFNRPKWEGNQTLHFNSRNKHFSESEAAKAFVATYLREAKPLNSDADVLRFASENVAFEGGYLEMGVCTGKTINFIAALNPTTLIHGFDSFEGLPEDWVRDDQVIPQGSFGFRNPNEMPYVLHNVILHKGWFHESLPRFKATTFNGHPIALLHIDCDLYCSTVDILTALEENIVPGTIIVFDEFYNYPGAERHEFRAFIEFLERTGLHAEYLAYNVNHEQVAVRMTE